MAGNVSLDARPMELFLESVSLIDRPGWPWNATWCLGPRETERESLLRPNEAQTAGGREDKAMVLLVVLPSGGVYRAVVRLDP